MKRTLILGLLVVAGCRSMAGVEEEASTQEGVVRSYSVSKQKALEVAKQVLKEEGADEIKEGNGYLVGSFNFNLITPGSYCGVFPKETERGVELRVVSRRKSAISCFTCLTEETFHESFQAKLGIASK